MKFSTAFAIPVAVCLLLGAANTLSAQGTGRDGKGRRREGQVGIRGHRKSSRSALATGKPGQLNPYSFSHAGVERCSGYLTEHGAH